MRDYVRDDKGRFADVPGVGDDVPKSSGRKSSKGKGGDKKTQPSEALKTAVTGSRSKKLTGYAETLDILAGIKRRQGNAAEARKISKVAAKARQAAADDGGEEWERKRREATNKQRSDYEAAEKARRESSAQRAHEMGMAQQKMRADAAERADKRAAEVSFTDSVSGMSDSELAKYNRSLSKRSDTISVTNRNAVKAEMSRRAEKALARQPTAAEMLPAPGERTTAKESAKYGAAIKSKLDSATQPGGTSTSVPGPAERPRANMQAYVEARKAARGNKGKAPNARRAEAEANAMVDRLNYRDKARDQIRDQLGGGGGFSW